MKKHDYGNVPDADRITDAQRFAELREVLMNMKKPSEYFDYDFEKNEIITYREAEHDLLMSIRNGKYLDENSQPNCLTVLTTTV